MRAFSLGKYSDVVLVVMGEAFELHRVILARSRYFEGLFSGPWAESENKVVHLQIDNPYVSLPGQRGECAQALSYRGCWRAL